VRQSSPIASYLYAIRDELGFDAALSRRVLTEVEDHLWSAAEGHGVPSHESEERAIANFGDAAELARQYLAVSLLGQVRRTGAVMLAALTGIFVAMKARVAWYELVHWPPGEAWSALRAAGLALDRYGFLIAIALALVGVAYIGTRRVPRRFDPSYGNELSRCVRLCCGVTGALVFSVVTETALTGIRLWETQWSATASVPIASLAVEVVAVIILVLQVRIMSGRMHAASSLLEP
jgi:hypothetical protein